MGTIAAEHYGSMIEKLSFDQVAAGRKKAGPPLEVARQGRRMK